MGRREDVFVEELRELLAKERLEKHKLQGNYQLLYSQYEDQKRQAQLYERQYNEISGYLMELETVISQHDPSVRISDIRKKEPKDRIHSIVNQVNKKSSEYTNIILELRSTVVELQRELKNSNELLEEKTMHIEEMNRASLDKFVYTKNDVPVIQSPKAVPVGTAEVASPQTSLSPTQVISKTVIASDQSFEQLILSPTQGELECGNQVLNDARPVIENTSTIEMQSREKETVKKETEIIRKELLGIATNFLVTNSDKMTKLSWLIIFTIGSQGLNERGEIEDYLKQNTSIEVSTATLSVQFNTLESMGLIDKEKVSTGKRPNVFIHELTKLGVGLYIKEFESEYKLQKSEKKRLIQMHDNVNHGYFIKDVKSILLEMGYKEVVDDRKSNTFDVFKDGKNFWIPDITGISPNGEKVYIECELANHTSKDFDTKLHKASLVTHDLYFVTRDKDSLKKLQNQLANWYLRGGSIPNHASKRLQIYTTTSNTLHLKRDFGEPYEPNYVTEEG